MFFYLLASTLAGAFYTFISANEDNQIGFSFLNPFYNHKELNLNYASAFSLAIFGACYVGPLWLIQYWVHYAASKNK